MGKITGVMCLGTSPKRFGTFLILRVDLGIIVIVRPHRNLIKKIVNFFDSNHRKVKLTRATNKPYTQRKIVKIE